MIIHVPSGTRYGGITNVSNHCSFQNVRVGGPYTVTASFVGFKTQTQENIATNLGTATNVNFKMVEEGSQLQRVLVKSSK
ncbi:MAG: carboxypeptidase-like regulatory domain-containing protein [Arcicella sp.]|nr:carboxypeptidase-like regulatory domain-containing protein [Arcicella sp.]